MTSCRSVYIIDTSELKEFLGDRSSNNTSTTRSWDELNSYGTGLSSNFTGYSMHVTDLVTPITSSDWDKRKLGGNKSTLNSNLDLLGNLNS